MGMKVTPPLSHPWMGPYAAGIYGADLYKGYCLVPCMWMPGRGRGRGCQGVLPRASPDDLHKDQEHQGPHLQGTGAGSTAPCARIAATAPVTRVW